MKKVDIADVFNFCKKSKLKAGDGLDLNEGKYPFYTSSGVLSKSINEYLFSEESLIFGTGGQASLHYTKGEFSVSTDCFVLQPKLENIKTKYVYYYLKGNIKILEEGFKGAGLKHISKSYIQKIKIPLPDLATQQAIVKKLDAAQKLCDLSQAIVEKYENLSQSLFLEMFGDPVTNPKGWEVKTIEDLVSEKKNSIKRGPFGGALKKEIFVEEGYLVYEQYHALNNDFDFERYFIDEEKFNELKSFEVEEGDIIISCSGVYLGKLSIVPKGAKRGIINQALLKLTLNQNVMKNIFFVYVFSYKRFKEKYFASTRGAGIPNFPPMSDFKKFKFITPPIELQNQFAANIAEIERQKALAEQELAKSQRLFAALLQESFS
ncbi:restriction endonuclease subunit S [Ornithobacterium rhinotracheale]|uniref:restriction endonuclease subunit S n=1 Tax=Ornithobacterium rhinotracheale TaxID=28251 RepID=UPI00129C52E3|nr:restriction endonuclease subunit S [Ornithobacterium rhinotracheale]MRJ09783.1 restriction endonuclease subunit S [Ornithobacterium rhinotracheale]